MPTSVPSQSVSGHLDRLAEKLFLAKKIWILTGAGISSHSGISTYRNHDGIWQHRKPIQHDEFIKEEFSRKKYWARSMLGWGQIAKAKPNPGHLAITELQKLGYISQVVTQNVDRLHSAAGTTGVVDLHGRLDRVICLQCDDVTERSHYQIELEKANPHFCAVATNFLPDGDAEVSDEHIEQIVVPPCSRCGGVLMPDVVFFGGSVPKSRVNKIQNALKESDCVLVLGSSLSVYSGFRFIKEAHLLSLPIYAINLGVMRGDALFDVIVTAPCETALPLLVSNLTEITLTPSNF